MSSTSWHRHALRTLRRRERGQSLVLAAFFMVVLLGFAALVIDVGRFLHGRQKVQTAVDAAALAAGQVLPEDGVLAENLALDYMDANDAEIPLENREITFRCIVGDRDGDGQPDATDIPIVCDPGAGASFTCIGDRCVSPCDFSTPGNKCNTVVVGAHKDVGFVLAPLVGVSEGNTGEIQAAACHGACGGPPTVPLDIVMVIDRTYSMNSDDINDAKRAAKAVLEILDPTRQHVALAVLPQGKTTDHCTSVSNWDMDDPDTGDWLLVGLSDDYQNPDGTLNTSSELVSTINCLKRAPSPYTGCLGVCYQTNLGEPVKAAIQELETNGRPDVDQGIIFLTDGQANLPEGGNPCLYASEQALLAEQTYGIEMFTVGYGIEGAVCDRENWGSPWRNELVTELMADMASVSLDDCGHCETSAARDEENVDGDHFLCEAKGEDLEPLFRYAAEVLASGTRLIQIPD